MKITNTFLNPIFCIVFPFLLLAQSSFAQDFDMDPNPSKRTLALVIGISDYKYLDDLQYAHLDAEDFAKFLTTKEGLGLPKSDVVVFTNEQATKNNLVLQGLDWLEQELNKGDEAYIYFSGHGDIINNGVKNLLKTGYLLTYESKQPHLEMNALRMDYFLTQFHTIASKKEATIRLILDVCHAGYELEKGVVTLLEVGGNLDPDKQIIITSCKNNEYSWEYPALKNSCFSYFLLEGMKGDADEDKNGEVTLEELEAYSTKHVNKYVKIKSRDTSRQSPQFKGNYYHILSRTDGQYVSTPIDYDKLKAGGSGKGVGNRKGMSSSTKKKNAEVESILEGIEDKSYSGKEIQNDLKIYLKQADETAEKRKMKRELVAEMVDEADKTLIAYYDKEDEILNNKNRAAASEYYLIAANLLGEDHFLYDDLLGKYFFMEALKLKTQNNSDDKEVINKLNTSLKFEEDASYTLNELGNVYYAKGEYEEALKYYEKAHKISPDWAKPLENKIKANNRLPKMLISSDPIPTSYEMVSDTKVAAKQENNSSNTNSSTLTRKSPDIVFNIQLAAASKVNHAEFKKVEDLGTITPEFNTQKNLINTWLGPFDSENEAKMKLKTAKQRGFKDAFIVEVHRDTSLQIKLDKTIAEMKKEQAAGMLYQVRIASVKSVNKTQFAELDRIGTVEIEPVTIKGKILYRVLMRSNSKGEAVAMLQSIKKEGFQDAYIFENKMQASKSKAPGVLPASYEHTKVNTASYKIQVASVSKLVENQFSNLEDLGQIYMDVVHDKGLIRVSLGIYQSKNKATEVKNKVKKRGYKDAFILIEKD